MYMSINERLSLQWPKQQKKKNEKKNEYEEKINHHGVLRQSPYFKTTL